MQNKPKLRFKEFNDEWVESTIGKVAKDSLSYGMNAPATTYDGINKYIRITDIDEENNTYLNNDIVSPLGVLDNKYLVSENDILFARTGASTGKTYLYKKSDGVLYYAGFLIKAHIKDDTCASFVFYNTKLDKYKKWVAITSLRSGQPGINAQEYSNYKIILPSIKEQKKIAEFLSKVDEVIAEREEEVKDLEQQKKGLMQKIFSQQLRFTDSNNNPYPDWKEKKIGDVFEFYNGKAHEQEIDENGEYIVVNSKFISTEGQVKKYTNKVICPLIKDDIVLVMSDVPNGKAMSKCYLIEEDNKYSLNQRICCLRTKDVARFFIYQISRNKYFLKFDNGVSQTNLRKEDVLKCPIQVPCLKEQQKIANVLSKLDELIEEKKSLLSDWQSFKKGLLQQMFV